MPFHPWRRLRAHPELHLFWRPLAGGRQAATDGSEVIVLRPDLSQVERRCSVAHELAHVELGHRDGCSNREEDQAARLAARWLIKIEHLADALVWAGSIDELADELWVDAGTARTRLDHLHPAERHYLTQRLASRDHTNEGAP